MTPSRTQVKHNRSLQQYLNSILILKALLLSTFRVWHIIILLSMFHKYFHAILKHKSYLWNTIILLMRVIILLMRTSCFAPARVKEVFEKLTKLECGD